MIKILRSLQLCKVNTSFKVWREKKEEGKKLPSELLRTMKTNIRLPIMQRWHSDSIVTAEGYKQALSKHCSKSVDASPSMC